VAGRLAAATLRSVSLVLDPDAADTLRRQAGALPAHTLSDTQRDDLELLLMGAYAPLRGYLRMADVVAVEARRTLANGTPWAVPVTLDTDLDVDRGDRVALTDEEGVLLAVLEVEEVRDGRLAGPVEGVALPFHADHRDLRATPATVRDLIALTSDHRPAAPRGRAVGIIVVRRPLHRPDLERIGRLAADRPLVVVTAPAPPISARALDLDTLVRVHRDALAELPGPSPLHVLVPLPRLHPGEQRDLADRLFAHTLGGEVVLLPDDGTDAKVGRLLARGVEVPAELTPTLVAVTLAATVAPLRERGFTVLFTGLSGSGKSTIATRVAAWLRVDATRPVTLLDGDVVRRHLSQGLGFSREDRDTNVRRIGWVAAALTRHRGAVVAAPIAPYAATRADVRRMVEEHGAFVLVHVSTPLEVCEARDRKGLYARARAGELLGLTGIDDPYEEPDDADLVIDTRTVSADDAAARVVDHLRRMGLIGG